MAKMLPPTLTFNRIRDVKSPVVSSEGAAGIDVFIPAYDTTMAVDLYLMNITWMTDLLLDKIAQLAFDWVPTSNFLRVIRGSIVEGQYTPSSRDREVISDALEHTGFFSSPTDSAKKSIPLPPGVSLMVPSGLKSKFPADMALLALNRGGMAAKNQIVRGACLTDSDYQGEIFLHFYTYGHKTTEIFFGQKAMQLLYIPYDNRFSVVSEPSEEFHREKSERGSGCLSSTGV